MDLFESLSLLDSLNRLGTTTAVATRQRMSQSTVSKRLIALQAHLGFDIILREGRNLRLTAAGRSVLERALPIARALQDALEPDHAAVQQPLAVSLGVAESILSTWGAELLRSVEGKLPNLGLNLHSHRGPIVLERVLSGDYKAGLIGGSSHVPKGIEVRPIGIEPMVLMYPPGWNVRPHAEAQTDLGLISIEEQSGTWQAITSRVLRFRRRNLTVTTRVESFLSAAAMCEAKFGPALVPLGVARLMGVKRDRLELLPGIDREITFVCRKRTLDSKEIGKLVNALRQGFPKMTL